MNFNFDQPGATPLQQFYNMYRLAQTQQQQGMAAPQQAPMQAGMAAQPQQSQNHPGLLQSLFSGMNAQNNLGAATANMPTEQLTAPISWDF